MAKEIKITAGIIFLFTALNIWIAVADKLYMNPQMEYTNHPSSLVFFATLVGIVFLIGSSLLAAALFFVRRCWITKAPSVWIGAGIGTLSVVIFSVFWLVFM